MSTFRLHPGPVSGAVLRELLLEVVEPLLVTRGHGVGEPRAVRVEDLEAVISSVSETVNSDLALQVLNVTAGDYRDLTVRKLRQSGTQGKLSLAGHFQNILPFERLPRLRGDDGQSWLLG